MNHASQLQQLEKAIGYHFKSKDLLVRAMIHRSFAHEHPEHGEPDNETLEFLGDAVLGLAMSHLLIQRFPQCNEGELSRLRSALVNEKALAKIAVKLKLGTYLLLGKGEERSGGRKKTSLLADSLEATFAAVYLDGGLQDVIPIVERLFRIYLEPDSSDDPLRSLDKDYKTQLQELTQAHFRDTPDYVLELEEGPDHDKTFFVRVQLNERVLAKGTGRSKKDAQQQAAREALALLNEEVSEQ